MKTLLVTGGAGFIGSNIAQYFAQKGWQVTVVDNLSRAELLENAAIDTLYNWNYLQKHFNGSIELIKGDVNDTTLMRELLEHSDAVVHTAGQTAVTMSISSPGKDFINNAQATFNLLEQARLSGRRQKIIFCSTNKVYGERINAIPVVEYDCRYDFDGVYQDGIDETFGIDLCSHSPYGCSKIAADIYCQEYAAQYGMTIGIFRMSCIYGPHQLGLEDQGWLAWFIMSLLRGSGITIYGDGKQVRDVLYVTDLVRLCEQFILADQGSSVYNIGGGRENAVSLREFITFLEEALSLKAHITYADWRPSDQRVFYANCAKVRADLGWRPQIDVHTGVRQLVEWYRQHDSFFKKCTAVG